MSEELMKQEGTTEVGTVNEMPMGFEDEEAGDVIIPRVKVVQTLSPEKKAKLAEEGDIINSLTVDKLNGKKFIPVFKFNNNIRWKDRSDGGGIACIARNGKNGVQSDGVNLICATCKKNEFDNSKTGKDAIPCCTKYINFFGFFEGDRMPIILSFAKTNYNEGKKMFSLAKVTMQNMWNFGYTLTSKMMAKGNNEWFIIVPTAAGPTSEEDRQFATNLYKQFRDMNDFNFDMDDASAYTEAAAPVNVDDTEY